MWLAPVQVIILPISEKFSEYCEFVKSEISKAGIRVKSDTRSEKVGAKIRQAELNKIPVMVIIGEKEMETKSVSVRRRHKGDIGSKDLDTFIQEINLEIIKKQEHNV